MAVGSENGYFRKTLPAESVVGVYLPGIRPVLPISNYSVKEDKNYQSQMIHWSTKTTNLTWFFEGGQETCARHGHCHQESPHDAPSRFHKMLICLSICTEYFALNKRERESRQTSTHPKLLCFFNLSLSQTNVFAGFSNWEAIEFIWLLAPCQWQWSNDFSIYDCRVFGFWQR